VSEDRILSTGRGIVTKPVHIDFKVENALKAMYGVGPDGLPDGATSPSPLEPWQSGTGS